MHTWDLEQEGKGRAGKAKRTLGLGATTIFSYMYRVAYMISLLVLACMAYACGCLVMICHWRGGFPRLIMDFPSLVIS